MIRTSLWTALICAIALSLGACEKKGPVEQLGEEIDEAVDTAKHGGEESAATKADDAMDEVREGVEETTDELKKD
jgi:predicted small lipoprotein YifL